MKRTAALAALLLAVVAAAPASAQRDAQVPLVRVPFPQDERNLTPYTFRLGYPLMTLVYDTLMWRDPRGVPRPWLARSVRRSPDGRSVFIDLRRGVRWHDGQPLTAGDVAFTFDFVARRPHPRFTPELSAVESVQADGRDRVVIRLKHPSLGFFDQPLSDLPILPRHIWADLPPDRLAPPGLPVGSGPYRLAEHDPGERYVFRANDRYFRGRPAVATVAVPIIRRADEMTLALQRRRVDALPVPLDARAARQLDDVAVRIADVPSYTGTVLMLNTRRPPFDRADARRAVAGALDLDRIAAGLSGNPGVRVTVPADRGYVHPGSRWAPRGAIDSFDATRARVELVELGLPVIRVQASSGDSTRLNAGRQVVLALRRAGARARLVEETPRELARAVGQDGSTPSFQAAIWSSPALASYDPDYMRVVFGGRDAPLDYSGYASGVFDRLARATASAPGRAPRRAAVTNELRRLASDAPVVPLFFLRGRFAYRPAVYDGWVGVRGSGILDKRSFMGATAPARSDGERDSPLAPPASDSGIHLNGFGIAALVLLAVAAAAILAAVVPRGRRR